MNAQINHRTRWTKEEDAFLQSQWDGHRSTTEVIAELLSRSVNAVAQRHYELTWGSAADPVAVKPSLGDYRPRSAPRVSRVEVTLEVDPHMVCTGCFTVRAASGDCWC